MPPVCKEARERSDTYEGEIFRSGDWRVALCRNHLQFLVQHRRRAPGNPATIAWDNLSFCQTRAALMRAWRALTGEGGEALLGLPEHVKDFGRTRRSSGLSVGREARTFDKRQHTVGGTKS